MGSEEWNVCYESKTSYSEGAGLRVMLDTPCGARYKYRIGVLHLVIHQL